MLSPKTKCPYFISSISFPNEPFFDIFFIKIRFSCNQNIVELIRLSSNQNNGEGESNSDEKNVEEIFNWSEVHSEMKYYLLIK